MEKLLKNIERSEKNNPLLTEALQEIARLNGIIDQVKTILEATTSDTTFQEEGGEPYRPTFDQLNDTKIDLLSNLLHN
ncbi:hypothetical protein [Pedobacter zeae]|uniref:Uncharacterized protein n=1 Tax=Pedobacter zeae TaxID=1737356 RepID=A0A7W6KD47_9SPHI|nr:hypothetical protein [Pedobacter zeae]MBB4108347.1 hypothetical protein [Pedobacter zeae]GGG93394.1 hypothetical protein GCM10007422_03260 [Pedobacter zeae]